MTQTACGQARQSSLCDRAARLQKIDGHVQVQAVAAHGWRRQREGGFRPFQHRKRLLVELGIARPAYNTTVEQTPLPVDRKDDLGRARLTATLRSRRVAQVLLERGED